MEKFTPPVMAQVAIPALVGAAVNAALKVMKPGISYGLDAAAKRWPKFKGARQFVKGATGFAERRVSARPARKKKGKPGKRKGFAERISSGQTGGGVVTTCDAPVAFARGAIANFCRRTRSSPEGEVVHVCNLMGPLVTNAVANTFDTAGGINGTPVYPTNATLFPSDSSGMLMWSKYKLKMFRVHYCHFAPTSSQAAVMLWWHPDPDISTPTTAAILMAFKNVAQGSCYEDLGLDCDLKTLPMDWLDNEATVVGDNQLSYAGKLTIGTDNNIPTSTKIGNLYCEAIFEFRERKPVSVTSGVVLHGLCKAPKIKNKEKLELLRIYLKEKVDAVIDEALFALDSTPAEDDFTKWTRQHASGMLSQALRGASMSATPSALRSR